MFFSYLAVSLETYVSVMTRTQIHCHMLFSTEEHLVCSQIHGSLWGFGLAVCSMFNPPLLQCLLPSILSTGPMSSGSIIPLGLSFQTNQILSADPTYSH